jgi:hypothetical protein
MAFIVDFPTFNRYHGQDIRYLQPKYDGHLLKIHRHPGALTTLSKNDIVNTDKVLSCPEVRKILDKIPDHTIAFAELFSKGAATDVPTLLNEGSSDLRLRLFAAPVFGSHNLFNKDLCDVQDWVEEAGIPFAPTSRIRWTVDVDALLLRAKEEGLEGWVLKKAHMKGWYKLKPTKELDAFVIGTKKSWSANYFGDLEGIVFAVYDGPKCVIIGETGNGFDDDERKIDPKTLIDRVCEIEYDSFAKNRLKFPRFVRWRDDKEKKDCKWSQLC